MAFTVNDLQDLTRLLLERPEWLSEVRRIVLTDELLALPRELAEAQRRTDEHFAELADSIRQLAEAQQRTDKRLSEFERRTDERFAELAERLDQLTARVDQLTARVDQLTQRLDQLTARVDQLTQRLDQLTARVDQLTQRLDQLTARVDQLTQRLDRLTEVTQQLTTSVRTLENQMAAVRGRMLETEYRDKAASFFGLWVRKPRVVSISDIWDDLEDRLSRQELEQLLPLDLLVRGQLSRQQSRGEIWLAVEISSVIDTRDVERAVERAALLRKAGFRAVPVVAGHGIANDAIADQIAQQHVAALMNGLNAGWEAALQRVVSELES